MTTIAAAVPLLDTVTSNELSSSKELQSFRPRFCKTLFLKILQRLNSIKGPLGWRYALTAAEKTTSSQSMGYCK